MLKQLSDNFWKLLLPIMRMNIDMFEITVVFSPFMSTIGLYYSSAQTVVLEEMSIIRQYG